MSLPGRQLRPAERAGAASCRRPGPAARTSCRPGATHSTTAKARRPPASPGRAPPHGGGKGTPSASPENGTLQAPQLPFSCGPQPPAGTIRRTSAPSRPLPAPHGASRNAPGATRPPTVPWRRQLPPRHSPRSTAPQLTPTAANQDGGERESCRAAFRDMGREGPPRGRRRAPPERAKSRRPRRGGYTGPQSVPRPVSCVPFLLRVAIRGRAAPAPPCRHQPGQPREAPGAWWSPWRRAPRPPRPGERRSGPGPGRTQHRQRAGRGCSARYRRPSRCGQDSAAARGGSGGVNPGAEVEGRPGRASGASARRREPAAAVEQAEEPYERAGRR